MNFPATLATLLVTGFSAGSALVALASVDAGKSVAASEGQRVVLLGSLIFGLWTGMWATKAITD